MTLVQVLANETSVHVACDFRLTNVRTMKVEQNEAHKLVGVGLGRLALIGVTGVAELDGKPIGEWIAEATSSQNLRSSLQDILDALMQAEAPLARIPDDQFRRHTFVIGAIIGTQSVLALVSNFERIVNGRVERSPAASLKLTISRIRPKAELVLVTGVVNAVTAEHREKLCLALRSGRSDEQIQEQMSQINAAAASHRNSMGMISTGCHVASIHASGRGSGRSFLTDEQKGDFIPPEFAGLMKQLGIRINPAVGPDGQPRPIRVKSVSSISTGASRKYFREQLRLQPSSAEIWNNYGTFLNRKRDFDEATDAFQHAVSLDPANATALVNLAKNIWQHGDDLTEADRLYAEAVRATTPDTPTWILSDYATFCDVGLSDSQRAAELYEAATRDSSYYPAYAQRAYFIYRHSGDREHADSLLAEALEKQPNNVDTLIVAGQINWFYKGQREAARDMLQKACTLDPRNDSALRLAGDFSLVLGDPSSAGYYYRRLMNHGAFNAEDGGNYGLSLLMNRKLQGAFRQLSKAHRLAPTNQNILVNLAATLWALGRQGEAASRLREVLTISLHPEIELEVLAMSRLIAPSLASDAPARIRALIENGVHADGTAIRSMAYNRTRAERDQASRLADAIEGTASIPSTL